MTLSVLPSRVTYSGTTSPGTGPFAFQKSGGQPILVLSTTELVVKKYPAAGPIGTFVVLNPAQNVVDYTISTTPVTAGGVTYLSCSVTLAAPLVTGDILVLERVTPAQQTFSPQFGGPNAFSSYENAWDALTKMDQEAADALARALLVDDSWDGLSTNTARFNAKGLRVGGVQNAVLPDEAIPLGQLAAEVLAINPSITPVSSFMAAALLDANAAAARASFGVQTAYSDAGVSVGTKFFALIPGLSDSTTKGLNTAAIQAAIDYTYANQLQVIDVSAGVFFFNPCIYLDAPGNLRAVGQIQFTTNPANNTFINIFGTVVTFVTAGPTGNQVLIGANLAATLSALLTFLQGSADINLSKFTYGVAGNNLNVTAISGTPTILGVSGNFASVAAGASAPTISSFSLHLRGRGGLGNGNNCGTQLLFTDNTQVALAIGPGQGMRFSGFTLMCTAVPTSRAALPISGIGIGLAGGGLSAGGISRWLADDVWVSGFRQNIATGFNANNLCDSGTLRKCVIGNGFEGLHVSQNQNFINFLDDCAFFDNTTHVLSDEGKAVTVIGGNYSATDANHNAFAISGTSALSPLADNYFGSPFTNYTFTTTLSADDQPMKDGAYTVFTLLTSHFGIVPLVLTNYNSGTKVATFKLKEGWMFSLLNTLAPSTSDLTAEIQACSTLYAAEKVTVFSGNAINWRGIHVENPGVVTTLHECAAGFGGDTWGCGEELELNYTQSQQNYWTNGVTPALDAIFLCQTMTPWLRTVQGNLKLSGIGFGSTPSPTIEGPLIEMVDEFDLRVERSDIRNPRFWLLQFGSAGINSPFFGSGNWDNSPFQPPVANPGQTSQFPFVQSTPFQGWRPARWAVPRLTPQMLANIEAGPGALTTYPPLFGDIAYSRQAGSSGIVGEFPIGAGGGLPTATLMVRSAHDLFSYGQNLTLNWTYKGQGFWLYVSDMSHLFPGLAITLNNVDGNIQYVITELYPTLGFVKVVQFQPGSGAIALDGNKTTIFSGASVIQAPYSFSRIGTLPQASFVANAGAGATTAAVGDLTGAQYINLKLSAVGAANYTTRTAAQMVADVSGAFVGMSYEVEIENTSSGTTTLAGGAGVTVTGQAAIPANSYVRYEVTFTSLAAVTMTATDAGPLLTLPAVQSATNTGAGATTAAAGDLTGAQIVNLKLTAVGAANYTTRTAAQMFADLPGAYVGLSYELRIENTNAGTTTLAAGTGVTLTGTMTIAQNTTRIFTVTFTGASAVTIESRGVLSSV